ncbi:sensor histidine kinase [Streptomyces sp. 3MP-14]|uniref:histidine kinase n=1 Tax=Streptomyces mimosae TaxID=2586635 RepID=A0A5N6AK34_9ACTN|nr:MULTISPECIES: sensor histidine kinase [Streptomyces]KAB8168575.1 sensor histidine kinase [Streptomyces mimosae]KAB8178144.1 sensor histidine kinase [Streptomyces sp. 3MP-14]
MRRERPGNGLLAAAQGLLLMLLSLGASLTLFALFVVSLVLVPLGVGLLAVPVLVPAIRANANQRRQFADSWCGISIPDAYRPLPHDPRGGIAGQVYRAIQLLKDPATWRDVLWLLPDGVVGFVLALLPFGLLSYGLWGLVFAAGVWVPIVNTVGTFWWAFVPVSGFFTAMLAGLVGLAFIVLGLRYNTRLIALHFHFVRVMIGAPEKQLLAQRVARLQETRHDAVDDSAAELRRIERDLHDGAQARLVAMGMSLGAVEALIEKDPNEAKRMLAQARANSAEALTELRDLVRGIHPPVLAERGLGDAARALALRMQVPVEVDVELPGRLEEPVESAAYFAISEVLTNAAKHARAERIWLDIYYNRKERTLRVAITDNGRGGASLEGGSGLRGLQRRLGAFDGVLAISSPEGGPTLVTIEIPCSLARRGQVRAE